MRSLKAFRLTQLLLTDLADRLGPLSIEQKKRNVAKRTKFEKNKSDEKKPQEITEDDITRSGNETTKNVVVVRRMCFIYSAILFILAH